MQKYFFYSFSFRFTVSLVKFVNYCTKRRSMAALTALQEVEFRKVKEVCGTNIGKVRCKMEVFLVRGVSNLQVI